MNDQIAASAIVAGKCGDMTKKSGKATADHNEQM
jgi:hypothetical protein